MPFTLSSLAFRKSQNLVRSGVLSSRSDTALGCVLPFSIPLFNGSNRTTFNNGLELEQLNIYRSNRTTFNNGLERPLSIYNTTVRIVLRLAVV